MIELADELALDAVMDPIRIAIELRAELQHVEAKRQAESARRSIAQKCRRILEHIRRGK